MLGVRSSSTPPTRPQANTGSQVARAGNNVSPTTRIPGTSAAAAAEAERRRSQLGRWAAGGPPLQGGGDGSKPLRNNETPKADTVGRAAVGGSTPTVNSAVITRNSWAALSEEEEEDNDDDEMDTDSPPLRTTTKTDDVDHDDGRIDHDDGRDADGDEVDESAGREAVDEVELRRVWQEHCHACKVMERNASDFPPRLLEEAKALRDSAEQRWRSAKQPQPLHKRLRWAESALRDAESKEDVQRRELQRHDAEAEQRRREIEGRVAVAAARTARKRAALDALRLEASPRAYMQASEKAARVAFKGIATDVAPPLAAVIERLATPLGDDAEAIRQELQLVAVSLSRVEGVLRDGSTVDESDERPECYDISDAATDKPSDDGGNGKSCKADAERAHGGGLGQPSAGSTARWAKQADHGVWRRSSTTSSVNAVEEARRTLQERTAGASVVGSAASAADPAAPPLRGADTNDLAEAARRDKQMAEQQVRAAHQLMQSPKSDQQARDEELQRQQRLQDQQDELRRHQEAMHQVAQQRAAEEARQREALIASMSPHELARAMELHAQQSAIGAQVFGTQSATQLAGMVQQAESRRAEQAEVQRIMEASQEELAAMQNCDSGACPW